MEKPGESPINTFIEIPSHIEETLISYGKNEEQIKKIIQKFRQQYPEIDEKSYNLLERENKKIGKNYIEIYKKETELNELINYSFFKIILKEIKKENKEIKDFKIYNTYSYTDRKTGVDYIIFIQLNNGINIAFGIDLKNGRNTEENYNEIITGIFTLITQNLKGESLNYEGIKKNIEISKSLYNHVTKQKRKYTIGINNRNQNTLNNIIIKEILTTKLDKEIKELRIYEYIKSHINNIINNEIEASNNNILGTISYTKDSTKEILDRIAEREKFLKLQNEKKKKIEKTKKENASTKTNSQALKQEKIKYETGKNYTPTKTINDIKELLEGNKNNFSQQIRKISKKLNNSKKAKQRFLEIYQSIKPEKEKRGNRQFYKIEFKNNRKHSIEIKYISQIQKNRIEKIYNLLENKT